MKQTMAKLEDLKPRTAERSAQAELKLIVTGIVKVLAVVVTAPPLLLCPYGSVKAGGDCVLSS